MLWQIHIIIVITYAVVFYSIWLSPFPSLVAMAEIGHLSDLELTWNMPGNHLEITWNMPGMDLEWTWNGPGNHLEWAWNGPGMAWNSPGMGLKKMFLFFTWIPPGITWNGKRSEFEFFTWTEVGIYLDSYQIPTIPPGITWIPTIPPRSGRNTWGRVKYCKIP